MRGAPLRPKTESISGASFVANSVITPDRGRRLSALRRLWIAVAVAAGEIFLLSFLYDSPASALPFWQQPVFYANTLAKIAVVALPLLIVALWPRRHEILETRNAAGSVGFKSYVIANIALFAALLSLRFAISQVADRSFGVLAAYAFLLLATGASMALLAAPPSFWRRLVKLVPTEIVLALTAAGAAVGIGRLAQDGWDSLSSATLALSHWFLTLYEPNALLDGAHRTLGVGNFAVQVFGPCSGYEGLALIVAFLPIYLWVFRRDLRFPNVLLLLPMGIAAIWTFNALRIALLVSIGAHISPEVAVQGFHSQGGWISFLIVTLSCIAVSRRMPFFAAQPVAHSAWTAGSRANSGAQASIAFLAPFMALVAASILAAAFAPHDQWLYAVKVLAVGATLWWFRGAYRPLLSGVSSSSAAIGLAVGAIWIATDPGRGLETPLGTWLASLPVWIAALWLGLRAFGSITLVPVAEELAFRGYLARALISIRFETVAIGQFRLIAFIGSSVAFGLMHQRWIAGCLAGAVYALLMYRSKRLSDPIAAHAASNAVIMVWAVAAHQWSLL